MALTLKLTLTVRLCCAALVLWAAGAAWGNDRPFQVGRTAVMEDDENVWSIETWAQRFGRVRGLSFEPEYTFSGGFSIQGELTRLQDRGGAETGHEAEIELKQLFNHIGRDGYGLGISLALGTERSKAEGTVRHMALRLPLSIALGDSGGYLHLNVGAEKASDARRVWASSIAVEHEVYKRTLGFAEFARTGERKFAQIGVRHWLRKEQLALDFALQQQRSEGQRASGFILGLGLYDF